MPEFCSCPLPSTSSNPRTDPIYCGKCGHQKDPKWDQTDENFEAFWWRIISSYQGFAKDEYKVPETQQALWLQTKWREKFGRTKFGYSYLGRDNRREAREEIADAIVYLYEDVLDSNREGLDPEWDVVLEIADDLLSAYGKLNQLKHKHRGVPA